MFVVVLLHLLLAASPASSAPPVATPSADDVVAAGGLPSWVEQPHVVRRLLSGKQPTAADGWPAGVVVAKGGGGHYETIAQALAEAPNGKGRYVIRVKAGVYSETLVITRRNVVLIGDGVGKTIITGKLSNATNTKMIWTGTVSKWRGSLLLRYLLFRFLEAHADFFFLFRVKQAC
jgi:pectinesterase